MWRNIHSIFHGATHESDRLNHQLKLWEALPTVILGFLAGLWLAPFVELHLPGVFSLFLLTPIGIVLLALVWWKLPSKTKKLVPDGWQAAVLVIPIIIIAFVCVSVSPYFEQWMFDGDIRIWMSEELGIGFLISEML